MMAMLEKEFPDIISIKQIGSTWEGRPIQVIQLDARSMMEGKNIKEDIVEVLPPEKRHMQTNSSDEKKDVEDMSETELLEKNEDINRNDDKVKKEKTESFNSIDQKVKEDSIADQLGIDMV